MIAQQPAHHRQRGIRGRGILLGPGGLGQVTADDETDRHDREAEQHQ